MSDFASLDGHLRKQTLAVSRSFGLCSSAIAARQARGEPYNYETNSLITEANKVFDDVIVLDPTEVRYQFERGNDAPRIVFKDTDVSNLSCVLVRGTSGLSNAIKLFIHALSLNGCKILDSIERFNLGSSSKLLTTVRRHKLTVGSSSYFAFSASQARRLIRELAQEARFPILTKPIDGRLGKGVALLASETEAHAYVEKFFDDAGRGADTPLFLQRYMGFVAEYRVMFVGGRCLGVVRKTAASNALVSNAAAGGSVSKVEDSSIEEFVAQSVSREAILGVDVGEDAEGSRHIIEENHAPLWEKFEEVSGVNVAQEVIRYARRRCD